MRRLVLSFALCLLPAAVLAQGALPPRLMTAIKSDPAAYLQEVAALIAGAGQGDAITADQLAVSIAVRRAQARAAVVESLVAADLDGDGAVTRAEMLDASGAMKAGARVRLDRQFAAADGDGDGVVTAAELASAGDAAALSVMGPARLAEVKVLMGFDANGDGRVTLDEVRSALQSLVS